ncbi:hypothetical protein SDC9_192941 [bioreactor metagenome]|uniref:Uncharacterized protein n=1 Tax=bioreactor metagenome TaxID=1076179 RepID=A0A645IAL5_9ZZZZ
MIAPQILSTGPRQVQPFGLPEDHACADERVDQQAVPGCQNLLIACRTRTTVADRLQHRDDVGQSSRMRQPVQLQGRQPTAVGGCMGAARQVATIGHMEDALGKAGVLAEVFVEKLWAPQVVGAFDMLTGLVVGVGVEAGGEPAAGQQHLIGQPADDTARHPFEDLSLLGAVIGYCT